jgi:hypothetical protein
VREAHVATSTAGSDLSIPSFLGILTEALSSVLRAFCLRLLEDTQSDDRYREGRVRREVRLLEAVRPLCRAGVERLCEAIDREASERGCESVRF